MSSRSYISTNRWPIGIIVFFSCLAVANVFLFVTAMQGRPGKVTDNPYQDSLFYEELLSHERLALSLGVKLNCNYGPANAKGLRLTTCELQVNNQADLEHFVDSTSLSVSAQYANSRADSITAKLVRDAVRSNVFSGEIPLPQQPGIWFFTYELPSALGLVVVREKNVLN